MPNVNIPNKVSGDTLTAVEFMALLNFANGYSIYRALVTQTGTGVPVLTVLQNTTGLTITPTRQDIGEYRLGFSANQVVAKTFVNIGAVSNNFAGIISANKNVAYVALSTWDTVQAASADGILNTNIEILIYP